MAGGEHLNPVDYPPLPSVNQYQNKNQPSSSSNSRDRDKQFSAAKVLNPSNSSHQNHVSIDFVVGSMPIPPFSTPLVPQISVTKDFNRLSTSNPRPPSTLLEPQSNQQASKPSTSPNPPQENSKVVPVTDSDALVSPQFGKESNLAMCFKGSFPCKPIHKILDTPCVSFDVKDKDRLLSGMGHILIVKFTHFRPKFGEFKAFLQNLKFKSVYKIIEFDYKHIFIDFVVFEDCIKLWMLKSIVVGGSRGRLFMWDGDFKPAFESPIAPIWIHLPQFPFYLFDELAMLSIASLFGKPIYIDLGCLGHDKSGVMSFCVSKDVRIKGPSEFYVEFVGEGIVVERFKQVVLYGSIPDYCSFCLHLGHNLGDCKVRLAPESKVIGKEVEVSVQDPQCVIPLPSVFSRFRLDFKSGEGHHRVDGGLESDKEVRAEVVTKIQDQQGPLAACSSSQDINPSLKARSREHMEDIGLMAEKESLGFGKELVLSEDLTERENVVCGLSSGEGISTLQANRKNFTASTLEPNTLFSGATVIGAMVGTPNMVSKVAVKAALIREPVGEVQDIAAGISVDELPIADLSKSNSDSFTAQSLEPKISNPGAVLHSSLDGDACLLSKDDVHTDNVVETAEDVLDFVVEKSAEGSYATALQNSRPDSPVATNLKSHFSIPKAGVQGLLVKNDNMIDKIDVRADKDLESTVEELEFVAETSVAEPSIAGQNLLSGADMQGSLVGDPYVPSIVAENTEKSIEPVEEEQVITAEKSTEDDKQENLMQQVPLMKANDDCSLSTLPISNNLMLLDQAVETYKEGALQSFDGVSLGFAQQVLSLLQHLMLSTPRASQSESSHTPKVVIKHPVTESKAGNASDLNHKVPKERFDFPPKSSTSSHNAPKKASKKFHKQFFKPP